MIRAFLDRLHSAGISLREVTLAQIDETLMTLITSKGYKRTTVKDYASNLRTFFRYAEAAGLCRPGLAAGIKTPRIFTQASLPTGPTWDEVRQMFALIGGDRPVDVRDPRSCCCCWPSTAFVPARSSGSAWMTSTGTEKCSR